MGGGLANSAGHLKLAFLCLGRSPESETEICLLRGAVYKTDLLKQICYFFFFKHWLSPGSGSVFKEKNSQSDWYEIRCRGYAEFI